MCVDFENGNWLIVGVCVGIYGIEEEIFQYFGIEFKCICMVIFGDLQIFLYLFKIIDVLIVLLECLINVVGDFGGVCVIDFDFFEIWCDIVFWMCKIDQNRIEYLYFRKVFLEYFEEK